MESELYRVVTFARWPTAFNVSTLSLARLGYFYTGIRNAVECFACKTQLTDWSAVDVLQELHKEKAPQCQLVKGNASINIPLKITNLSAIGGNSPGGGDTETDLAILDGDAINTIVSDPMITILYAAHKRASSKRVFSSSTDFEVDRSQPDYEKLRKEEVRLSTFHDWPSASRADPLSLAQEGLFYTGVEDRVQCAFCRGFMRNWEPTDMPSTEHRKHFPDCPFVRGQDVGNIPVVKKPVDAGRKTVSEDDGQQQNVFQERLRGESIREATRTSTREQVRQLTPEEPPKFPNYVNIATRVESFLRGRVSDGHTAEGLADAGWFWIGPGDKVQCFQCGGNLKEWEREDDPWDEHRRWYTNCSYLKNHCPTPRTQFPEPSRPTIAPTIGSFRVEPREVKARMDTATVRAIVNMGYSKDRIKMAIEKRLCTTGDDFPNAESLLEALFQLEEEAGVHSSDSAASGLSSVPVPAAEDKAARRIPNGFTRSPFLDSGCGTMSSSSSAGLHQHDSFVSLPSNTEPSSLAPSAATFQSMIPTPSEKSPSSSGAVAMAAQAEVATDAQSKSKGKRKRNKKKKANAASNEAVGEEAETLPAAQNDLEKLIPEGDVNLEEIPDEESLKYLEENRQLREARTCKVCMDKEVNTVFLPCGHLVCCNNCSPQLRNCPICRTFIRGTVKTFLS